jgi:hypothetical protein
MAERESADQKGTAEPEGNMSVREAGRKGGRRVAELIARAKRMDEPQGQRE